DHRITYAAYSGEVPVLLGGVLITDFKTYRGKIQQADIPKGVTTLAAFENDRRLSLARSPETGYYHLVTPANTRTQMAFTYREEDLNPKGWNLAGAVVSIWPHHDWFNHNIPIASIDAKSRMIVLKSGPRKLLAGNRYYVKNVLALLDRPGECRIASKSRNLYVWPNEEPIGSRKIVIATADNVIAVRGREGAIVRNLHFRGLDIGIANGDTVSLTCAEDCSLRFCKIENAQDCGVLVNDHAQRCVIYGCLIRNHGLHGVHLKGRAPGQADVNKHHVVENNHVHHCGRLVGHGYGVRIFQSGHNKVLHNHIHHMPRYATTIKGRRYQRLRKEVKGVTFENRHSFLHSRNNLIAYNDVHDTNMDSQDTGAMESWGPGRDNVYDHNLIRGTGNDQFNIQSGMYLDDATDYFTLTNNIIYGVTGTVRNQPIFMKGIGNRIHNNILIVGAKCDSAIASHSMADERCDHHEFTHNIIYFQGEPKGNYGRGVGIGKGASLEWRVTAPVAGRYDLWVRHASHNALYGKKNMGNRATIAVGQGDAVSLANLPDTGGWLRFEWCRAAGQIPLLAGAQKVVWRNVKGRGLKLDALVFCDDPNWQPQGAPPAAPAKGKHLAVIQVETYLARNGVKRLGSGRTIYHFVNWTKDRVVNCDYNLYYDSTGGPILMSGQMPEGGKDHSLEAWKKALGGKFDQHSVVADPMFIDPAKRDYRLKPDSPALKLGFKPIDTSKIGLKADFPKRFERE
ncbi:MAG: right-handed parallel beta-helix repeat-containing protein, partial [Phycisphaerae bacterium]|nr:right-handed parallel beta-helix repeat-containing protein [Phycisphaerae bacterium]